MHLKAQKEIDKIRASCRIAAEAMLRALEEVADGVSTEKLDQVAENYIRREGGVPSALGYRGYPKSICISVNEEVVHGIPGERILHLEGVVRDATGSGANHQAHAKSAGFGSCLPGYLFEAWLQ